MNCGRWSHGFSATGSPPRSCGINWETPCEALEGAPARRPRDGCVVPGLYSFTWILDQLRSFELGCLPVEGVAGLRS